MHHRFRKRHVWLLACSLLVIIVMMGITGVREPKAHAATGDGSPGDANIKYYGRWDTSAGTTFASYWGGAYFRTAFTGTTVQLRLGGSANIYVSIDNNPDVFYANASGTVNLTPNPLGTGTHTLRVAAQSNQDVIQFQGLLLDPGAATVAPGISSQIIEFIGDSITAGYDDSHVALSDYAWLIGEQLHVQHTQIAYPGICLVDNVSCYSPNGIGMSRQFFKEQTVDYPNSLNWDFSRYQASAVVINLGTNDSNIGISDSTFESSYVTFLQNIRAVYPNAPILVLRTFGGYKASVTQAAVSQVNAAGDQNVHYIDTTGWVSSTDLVDGVHPTDEGQERVANRLAPMLAPYLGVATINGPFGPIGAPGSKCVDVAGGNSASGTPVQLWDCNNSIAQAWVIASDGTVRALNKCLDIVGNGTAAGTKVQLWDCNGVGGQQWVSESNGALYNPQSGRCLDDPGGNTANGTQLQIWDCNNQWPQVYQVP